jgi:hypothetical protein
VTCDLRQAYLLSYWYVTGVLTGECPEYFDTASKTDSWGGICCIQL